MIGLVWAEAANGVIGADGTLPWHLPEDLAHFRALTGGASVLMGRRTWDSLPPRFRPLPGRRNLVLTRDRGWSEAGATAVHDLDDVLDDDADDAPADDPATASADAVDLWVIGGAQVYRAAVGRARLAVITQLRESFAGDCRAPQLGPQWVAAGCDPPRGWHESRAGIGYRFRTLSRS